MSLGSLSPHDCGGGYSADIVYIPPDYTEAARSFEFWIGNETADRPDVIGWDVSLFADVSNEDVHEFEWTFNPHQNQPGGVALFDQSYADAVEKHGLIYNVDFLNDYELNLLNVDPYLESINDDPILQYFFFNEPRDVGPEDAVAVEDTLLLLPFLYHFFDDVFLGVGLDETTPSEIVMFDGVTRPAIDTVTTGLDERGCFFYTWEQRLDNSQVSEADQADLLAVVSDAYGIGESLLDFDNFEFTYTATALINPQTSEVIEVISIDRLYAAQAIGYTTFSHLRFHSYET